MRITRCYDAVASHHPCLPYGWACPLYWRLYCRVAVLCSGWFGFPLPWVSVLVLAGLVPCFGLELSFVAPSMLGPCFQKLHTNAHRVQCLGWGPGHILTRSGMLSINTVINGNLQGVVSPAGEVWTHHQHARTKHPSSSSKLLHSFPVGPKVLQYRSQTKGPPHSTLKLGRAL
jgi:hypothetical protein